ncbi:MAG: EVE domain-containing protein [Verrucomicrobiota bacterium]
MNYWLFKSEPDVFSFADLKARPRQTEPWSGVRNYQARNYMRDNMKVGDLALFYHSSCAEPGVAGVMRIASEPYPDPTQFNPSDDYFDPKATPEKPIWMLVDVAWEKDLKHPVSLPRLRDTSALSDMATLRKGNRLSITPVTAAEFKAVLKLSQTAGE